MPLLNKKAFNRNELPDDLEETEEVFYCELTNEIFRDYEEFCERIILCNSLVWGCSLTGRANLTYQEALASEEQAKAMLNDFPMELRIPVLYLTTLTDRRSLNELAEDVYCFAKDRYFVGENVEVEFPTSSSPLTSCRIVRVYEPANPEIYKQTHKNSEREYYPPASSYRYEVEPLEGKNTKSLVISSDFIHRKKSLYSRAKNRLYIKQFLEQVNGYWKLKAKTAEKYRISQVTFDQIFVGDAPDLGPAKRSSPGRPKTGSTGKKEKKQESIEKYFAKKSPSKHILSETEPKTLMQKLKEKYKEQNAKNNTTLANKVVAKHDVARQKRKYTKKLLKSPDKNLMLSEADLKQKRMDERHTIREQKRKKKVQTALLMKEYYKKKEDLELEDLQDLPEPLPVKLRVPNHLFGDFVMVLEFLNLYKDILKVKDYFTQGVTIELLERALVDKEVAGPFCDILQMMLATIFELQDDEDDEIRDESDLKTSDWQDMGDVSGDTETKEAVRQATVSARWAQAYHRTPLNKLTLDASTLTEVLRLHLLASGGRCGDSSSKWRYQQRGGYSSIDDPGLMLRLTHTHILEALSLTPFCDLPVADKLAVLSCLSNQILTFASIRDALDERMEKIRQAKIDLRSANGNERKKEQEAIQKVKEGEWTVEQLEKEREQLQRNRQETNKKLRELNEENQSNQVLPLGVDRAYRRYWLFTAVPGLFVEHDERHAGTCLTKGTPALNLGLLEGDDPEMYIKRLFEQGDKENVLSTPSKTQMTPSKTPTKTSRKTPTKTLTKDEPLVVPRRALTCWADTATCPVHSRVADRTCWAFYKDEMDLDALIANLNKRGMREHSLQASLEEDRDKIVASIKQCPMAKLNPLMFPNDEVRKSSRNQRYENANLNFPADMPSDEILESVLRDLILETEDKINSGHLGSLKVVDRLAWREAILKKSYDQQCDKLTWGGSGKHRNNCVLTDGDVVGEYEEEEGRPTTPSSEASFRDLILDASLEQKPRIRELACAILQLAQSIDLKYLKRPLGQGQDKKDQTERAEVAAQVARERWQASLMTSTSISQLFLHISTLDTSIMWARSILKAYCRLCKRKGDPEKMLLCDSCNKGHHMYCLKPKLNNVPRGDWFCAKCKPREKVNGGKKRKIFSAESDNENGEEEKENETERKTLPTGQCSACRKKGPVLMCESCELGYHFECVVPVLRKVPSGNWYCQKCRRGNTPALNNIKKGYKLRRLC